MSGYRTDLITPAGIEALLKFLLYFQNPRSRFGTPMQCEDGVINDSTLSRQAERFVQACYRHHFVQAFDWGAWEANARRLQECPEKLAKADLATIGRLLTFHLRSDRFNDGHLLAVMKSGHIGRILARLQDIREKGR